MEQAAGRSLPAVLEELGYVSENRVAQAVAEQMGLAFVDVGSYDIDPNAATLVSSGTDAQVPRASRADRGRRARRRDGRPANIFAIDDLRIVTRREIRPVVAAESDLVAAIERFTTSQTNVDDMVGDLEDATRVSVDENEEDAGERTPRSPS